MTARSLAVPFLLSAGAVATALLFGRTSLAHEGGTPASFGFFANAVDSAMTRFAPEVEVGPDVVRLPGPSLEQKVASYGEALVEDALYRANVDLAALASASGLGPTAVLDGDWEVVANTKKIPHRAVCQIDTTWNELDAFGDPIVTSGTAAFVSPRVLVTSGKNIWRDDKGGAANTIQVYPGRKGTTRPYGTQPHGTLYIWAAWLTEEAPENDMGWIALADTTLYDRIDYAFDFRVPSDEQLEKWDLNSLSYPRPYVDGIKQYHDFETQNQIVAASRFRHYHDSRAESRGGPLYYQRNAASPRQIVGVFSDFPATASTNWACRMTQGKSDGTDFVIGANP